MRHDWLAKGALLCLAGTAPALARADEALSVGESGIAAELGDGALSLRLGGKVHFDGYAIRQAGDDRTGADLRRLRPDLRIEIANAVKLRVEREFSGKDSWRNLYAEIEPVRDVTLRAGQFNTPFGIEHLQSANTIPFAERSLAAALAQDYALGVQAGYSGRRFTAKAGWFGNAIGASGSGKGVAARTTWLAVDDGKTLLHIGLAADHRDYDPADRLRLSGRAGTRFANPAFRTGQLDKLSARTGLSGEIALLRGPFAGQAQYVRQWVERDGKRTRKASGGHVQAGWMVTGEAYRYSRSGGIPAGPRLGKRRVAVEIAARYSWANADFGDNADRRARAVDLSAGVYLNPNFKIMLSGGRAWSGHAGTGERRRQSTGVLRFVAAF